MTKFPVDAPKRRVYHARCRLPSWKGSIHREQFHLTNEVSTHREHF
jgi:hypothetical protein